MTLFVWDEGKELENILKHGVDFETAQQAFEDPHRIIHFDPSHSGEEDRYFCFGEVAGKVMTVRFTRRGNNVRIIGAGYWRKGKIIYEKEKN
ncbi:MAG: hypothetical protein A3C35_01300 [Omnitrophica bacterium RIFCSPHIGHO2_02_FULL_46_11]|nr:MAG: hypothetical protein A3C35_01300 [Omnitrophica bacterium RIFCSPHIGHO2_02_FULL_46_11]OGW87074.1 MAG: hypothetical protein A3A81_00585 [Omnitrophica bacterium RIFCSPLOWO2_01_FULL_45_10b]